MFEQIPQATVLETEASKGQKHESVEAADSHSQKRWWWLGKRGWEVVRLDTSKSPNSRLLLPLQIYWAFLVGFAGPHGSPESVYKTLFWVLYISGRVSTGQYIPGIANCSQMAWTQILHELLTLSVTPHKLLTLSILTCGLPLWLSW